MNFRQMPALIVFCTGFQHQGHAAPAKAAGLDTAAIRLHTGLAGKWNAAMVMGDLVLFQDEVNPVIKNPASADYGPLFPTEGRKA